VKRAQPADIIGNVFFRRDHPKKPTFEERLDFLRSSGFSVDLQGNGLVRVSRDNCAADIERAPDSTAIVRKAGVIAGGEIAMLVDGGYQKFLRKSDGKRVPALAADLRAFHSFREDLFDLLGVASLYNQSLGTTCNLHEYDRLDGRR
jgi:hypothetical protein